MFTDLGGELQQLLRDSLLLNTTDEELNFTSVDQIKQKASEQPYYREHSLFELAKRILKQKQNSNNKEKIEILCDLVQAYEFEKIYKLKKAVENQAFECNLRSYILGRLYSQLMNNEVEVYTVNPYNHTLLLVVERSTNTAYWVDPTIQRFYYKDGKRIEGFQQPFVKQVDEKEWLSISKKILTSPDNFHIFGNFDIYGRQKFATILPFRQGIEAGFWINIGGLLIFDKCKETSGSEKLQLLQQAYYCLQKALNLNPNNTDAYSNLGLLYTDKDFAEAIVRQKGGKMNGEELTEEETKEVNNLYLSHLLKAEEHYLKAIDLSTNPLYYNDLVSLYKKRHFAEAKVRQKHKKMNGEELTKEEILEVDSLYRYYFFEVAEDYKKELSNLTRI